MCKPKPYPRCSGHAKEKLEKAKEKLAKVKAQQPGPDASEKEIEKHIKKSSNAHRAVEIAQDEYDETPEGQKELDELYKTTGDQLLLSRKKAGQRGSETKNRLGDYKEYVKEHGRPPMEITSDGQQVFLTLEDHGRTSTWRNAEGVLHREDGPAIKDHNSERAWFYQNGKLHREGGPALYDHLNSRGWFKNGELHRTDGPAVMSSKRWEYWVEGKQVTSVDDIKKMFKQEPLAADGAKVEEVSVVIHNVTTRLARSGPNRGNFYHDVTAQTSDGHRIRFFTNEKFYDRSQGFISGSVKKFETHDYTGAEIVPTTWLRNTSFRQVKWDFSDPPPDLPWK